MNPFRSLSPLVALFSTIVVVAAGCGPNAATLRCAGGQTILDGTCVSTQVADFVVCIRSRGSVDLAGDRGQRMSAEAKSAGIGASTALEARESLAAKYQTQAGAEGERQVIDRCSTLINKQGSVAGADAPPPPTSSPASLPPRTKGTGPVAGPSTGRPPVARGGVPPLGSRVSRGPDWKWGEQGRGTSGTIIGTGGEPGWVMVRWDNNEQNDYRYGADNAQDVTVLPGLVPQNCDGSEDYGTISPGSIVIPIKHREVKGDANWAPEMDAYVGKRARVTKYSGLDATKCAVLRIDADNGQYAWRVRDMGMP
jgi:hypothetical protein